MTTQIIGGFSEPIELPARPTPLVKKRQTSLILLSLSLLVHLAIFFALSLGNDVSVSSDKVNEPISAILVFPTVVPQSEPEPNVEQLVPPTEDSDVQTQAIDKAPSEPEVLNSPESPPAQPAEAIASPPSPEILTTDSENATTQLSQKQLNLSTKQALQQFMQSHQDRAINEDGARAAKEHRRLKTSPDLPERDLVQEERKRTTLQPTKVNCDSGAAKTLAVISSFTGGRVQCNKRNDGLDKFIKKHVNKESDVDN